MSAIDRLCCRRPARRRHAMGRRSHRLPRRASRRRLPVRHPRVRREPGHAARVVGLPQDPDLPGGATERVKVGTGVLVCCPHTVATAKAVATIVLLSGGRVSVRHRGVGWLQDEFDASAAPSLAHRGAVTDEQLQIIKAIWTDECRPLRRALLPVPGAERHPQARAANRSTHPGRRQQPSRPAPHGAVRRRRARTDACSREATGDYGPGPLALAADAGRTGSIPFRSSWPPTYYAMCRCTPAWTPPIAVSRWSAPVHQAVDQLVAPP